MRAPGGADIGHRVGDPQRHAAEVGLDPPAQQQLLAEQRRLHHLALGPQHAVVAVPCGAVACQPGGQAGVPAVQPVGLSDPVRVVEHGRVVGAAEQRVVQAAGGHQAAGEPAEPADPVWLVVPGPGHPDRRGPGQRLPAQPRAADVEPPVDQDLELETSSRPAAQHAHPAFGAVAALDQPDPGHLLAAGRPGPGAPPWSTAVPTGSPQGGLLSPSTHVQSIRSAAAHLLVSAVSVRRTGEIKA